MCCSTAYPDHEEIYQELIKGKEHLLHYYDDQRAPSAAGPQDHTKSGGLRFDIVGKSFDGTLQDIESTPKKDTFDPLFDASNTNASNYSVAAAENKHAAYGISDLNTISEEDSLRSQEASIVSHRFSNKAPE